MKVKICGLTNLEDALAAAEAGADMLGFNFYPDSPRYIEPGRCEQIIAALRSKRVAAPTVGVFVNTPASDIAGMLHECGLDLAQLHGDEPPATLEELGGRAFKAIRPQTAEEADTAVRRFAHLAHGAGPALLVDAYRAGQYGGTGGVGDWSLAGSIAAGTPILLAGGLTPDNVSAAVATVRPWGTDVASGVESHPRRKDRQLMEAFVRAVQNFERETSQ
ncbi:MAG: N-(5'-phosphoribosyl)anthranilate isomerase [Anaerolineales bacterium]